MIKILADKIIELLRVRQENREKLFRNFLEPAYQSFESAHSEYIETFQNYREFVCDSKNIESDLIAALQKKLICDSIDHGHIRLAAISEAEILTSSDRYDFKPFISEVRSYFEDPIRGKSDFVRKVAQAELRSNAPRAALLLAIQYLGFSLTDEKSKEIMTNEAIDELIMHIQKQKEKVDAEYLKAKKALMML